MGHSECKKCSQCRRNLPFGNFYKDRTKKSGYSSQCKLCERGQSEREDTLPPVPAAEILAFNNWRGAQPGQLQGRAW